MEDERGRDAKLICVIEGDPLWAGAEDLHQLPDQLLAEIRHFFDVYKMLEPNKESSTQGYEGVAAARAEIDAARRRALGPGSEAT